VRARSSISKGAEWRKQHFVLSYVGQSELCDRSAVELSTSSMLGGKRERRRKPVDGLNERATFLVVRSHWKQERVAIRDSESMHSFLFVFVFI
jgi:hypothetical protein